MFPAPAGDPIGRRPGGTTWVCMSFAGRLIAAARRREGRWSGGGILPWKAHGTTQQRLPTMVDFTIHLSAADVALPLH
jgi:hypothetical protein